MRIYVDSDVLIWHLRGERRAVDYLRPVAAQAESMLCIGAMQRAEIVFAMRPNEEAATLRLLSLFETVPVDRAVVDTAGKLYRRWKPSHGLDPNDAILAATAMRTGGKIVTFNAKHYPMPDVVIEVPW